MTPFPIADRVARCYPLDVEHVGRYTWGMKPTPSSAGFTSGAVCTCGVRVEFDQDLDTSRLIDELIRAHPTQLTLF